ncbi:MAG: tetratricopeptide repeat protein [Oligoflexia bacterium]|nr:tetratricopeptide repeat protein [Oligoflexia bacterium]
MGNRIFGILGLGLAVGGFCGCSHAPKTSQNEVDKLKREILELQRAHGQHLQTIEDLQIKFALLKDQLESKKRVADVKPPSTTVAPRTGSEHLYESILAEARSPQGGDLKKKVDLYLKGYGDSPQAPNALFVLGSHFFDQARYLEASEQFERIFREYPASGKSVSALYKLAESYELLGRKNEAQELFVTVINQFPGSREARQAELHMKRIAR